MSPNYRRTVIALAERALADFGGTDLSRESADMLLMLWPCNHLLDDELRAEVLGRFPVSEPPAVPGLDFLAVEQDAKTIVAESLAEPFFCTNVYVGNEGEFKCDRPAGHGDHHWNLLAEFGWPVEPCCTDHSNLCGVAESKRDACCDECPEFGGAS